MASEEECTVVETWKFSALPGRFGAGMNCRRDAALGSMRPVGI
jgi:hypothetical protein